MRIKRKKREQIYNDNDDGTLKCYYIRQESKLKDISLIYNREHVTKKKDCLNVSFVRSDLLIKDCIIKKDKT
jgi:hypothetical protein